MPGKPNHSFINPFKYTLSLVQKLNMTKMMSVIAFSGAYLLCLVSFQSDAQGFEFDQKQPKIKGTPRILHYNRKEFNADPQFWAVCEDNDGILYFGNNDGAIIFDGEQWHKVRLPNNSSIRSLTADENGNIYAGGFNEFGLIKQDNKGRYYYQSLLDSLKFDDNKVENLWQVHVIDETIIYRSFSKLIAITGKKVTKLPSTSYFIKSFLVGEDYYVQDQSEGIFKLDLEQLTFERYFTREQLDGEAIIDFLPTNKQHKVMAVSKSGKIFHLDLQKRTVELYKELFAPSDINQIESAIETKDGVYYLGTLSEGIIRLNKDGQILRNERSFDDIQDKSVLNLYQTKQGNVWALLNNGLDCITLTSPVTTIFENASLYDVLIDQNEMYLATNQGVFYADSINNKKPDFKKIKGLEGQGWSLQKYADDILVGHDKGLYRIRKEHREKIGSVSGIWRVIPAKGTKNLFLAAGYSGLYVVTKDGNNWQLLRKIEGFEESTRDILETDTPGTFWVCHGYKGVFRIKLDESFSKVTTYEHFTTQNGLVYPYNINVFRWEEQIVFTTNQGIYTYDTHENLFKPYARLNNILDSTKNTRRLFQHQDKTWFVQDNEAGYFITEDKNPVLETGYFLQFKAAFNRGMECIVPLGNDRVMLGTKTGLYLFDLTYKNQDKVTPTIISRANYTVHGEEKWLAIDGSKSSSLPNQTNSLRIDFAAPEMQNNADIQYSYKLESIDKVWSDWQFTSFKDYAHLRPGKYTFKVRSRSMLGTMGEAANLHFEILPLWYQTKWAVLGFVVIAITLVILLMRFVNKRMEREHIKATDEERRAKKLLELEISQLKLKAEKERISKDKLTLQEDVIYKSKELANYTMLLVKKKEIFAEILDDIKDVRSLVRNEGPRRKLQKMFSKLNQHAIGEEYMQIFEANFERVHQDFFKNLKERYPDLTQRELRLCAFVKMNLTNKEIAPLLNISVRGVETARYRIRKKINLEHDHNFTDFLERFNEVEPTP